MSAYGSSSGRASVSSSGGRASVRPTGGYRDAGPRASGPQGDWPPRATGGGGGGTPPGDRGMYGGGGGGNGPYRGRRKPRWGRIAMLAGLAVLIVAIIAGISIYGYASGLDKDLKRTDAFTDLKGDRPQNQIEGALDILLVGTDSRDPDAKQDQANGWRADTLMLMHIPSDHKSAQLISIPRDLWVVVPSSNSAKCSDGNRAKINAAFAFGGLPRAVHTVECLTDVRIDHVMSIDFAGFKEVTDALGGVDLKVDKTIKSIHKPFREFKKGTMHMNGAEALDWVRQRKQFPRGDFDRMRHQQEFLMALMDKAVSTGTLTSPGKLNDFLKATTAAVTVDEGFSLTDTATQFRSLRSNNITFLTSPNKGSETINGQSVVVSDREKALALFKAVAGDKMNDWLATNKPKAAAK